MGKASLWSDVLEKLVGIHGDNLDFSKFEYKTMNTPSVVICPTHGEFIATASNLLYHKQGCKYCARDRQRKTTSQFIEQAKSVHGDYYSYDKVVYNGNKVNVIITCPIHGDFTQQPLNHLHGMGCPICGRLKANEKTSDTLEEFITKAKKKHGDKYDYSLVDVEDEYVKIKCNICNNVFSQRRTRHIAGDGCPYCRKYKLEEWIKTGLNNLHIDYIHQYKPSFLKNGRGQKSLDFYLPQYNVGIECQGVQHFLNVKHFKDKLEYTVKCDEVKNELCAENEINILYVYSRQRLNNMNFEDISLIYTQNNILAIEDIQLDEHLLIDKINKVRK